MQKNWYNFFVVNKATLKSLEIIPEPKLEMGSAILCAISDRGVGGKYLVGNLFRNKKVYIDYSELQVSKGNEQRAK